MVFDKVTSPGKNQVTKKTMRQDEKPAVMYISRRLLPVCKHAPFPTGAAHHSATGQDRLYAKVYDFLTWATTLPGGFTLTLRGI
ncbi:hypothetical protein DCC81_18980 [Chitinophaga parva]|uniref:Uncharacterized protein n=1 Tax=Chitinophaga parva TaxID=2169414 RepID=A0A2T7BJ45_9BACT|nr:hypothetical protein DCC81_18980 [Chitinophaga parva]